MYHGLSFDVENWFDGNLHRQAFVGPRDHRVVSETEWVLDLLRAHDIQATFFVLGRVACQYPALVAQIAKAGHEVGSHGFDHALVCGLHPQELLHDLRRSRALLQDLSGQPVNGYRAPSWSVNRRALAWVPSVIRTAGFQYSSSVFPMLTPLYGVSGAPVGPWTHTLPDGGRLPELPPAVARIGPLRVPFGGGIYWRLLPNWTIAALLSRAQSPAVIYLHPWELNSEPIRAPRQFSPLAKWVLTHGLADAQASLTVLLGRFRFAPLRGVFAAQIDPEVTTCACSATSSLDNVEIGRT